MTIKELKMKLEGIPDDMDVMLMQTNDESAYNMVETAEVRGIKFMEEDWDYENDTESEEEPAVVDCFVVTDEV